MFSRRFPAAVSVVSAPSGEPLFAGGTNTSYYFEPFSSYAAPSNLNFGGGGDHQYATTQLPTLSAVAPVGGGGKKATWDRVGDGTAGGGLIEWSPSYDVSPPTLPSNLRETIFTFYWRNTTDQYEGKGFLLVGQVAGHYRWAMDPHVNRSYGTYNPSVIADCYWTNLGIGKFADTPPLSKFCWQPWFDSIPSPPPVLNPSGFAMYHHNVNDSLFDQSVYLNSASLIRHTIRITQPPAGAAFADGKGRFEMWINGAKTHEWLGDDPTRPEFGLVFSLDETAIKLFQFPGPASFSYVTGLTSTVEYSDIRLWSP